MLLYGFVATRLAHFWAYFTAKSHEVRATFFTIGSLIVIGMAVYTLIYTIL
ncbi:MAG: MAPEG family protein [Acidobacteriota bacterium]|nr:MAPEG family protein [Acidobacteriota bacterium]